MNMGAQEPVQTQPAGEQPKKSRLAGLFASKGNVSAAEFIPTGQIAMTKEQFPDLLDDSAPAKGGKKSKKAALPKKAEVVDESSSFKGKHSSFFEMERLDEPSTDPGNPFGFMLNDEQWQFIYNFYPQYAQSPYNMMTWLKEQAEIHEGNYGKPMMSGKNAGEEDEEDDDYMKEDYGQGNNQKQKSKQQMKKEEEERRKKEKERLEDLKKKAGKVDKTDAQKEEEKIAKAFKDREVNMNPEGVKAVDTTRQPVSMVFIGHVDAGKSTICGNLMYMMGVVDQRTIDKFKQEAKDKGRDSWWLAYVMDVSDEEKAKGKTVEVGRANFDTKTKKYTIFDAPGHKNYVPNMIMGAACADIGGLVISARRGEFESGFEKDGQTREHVQLAKSLGIKKLIVIVNKMDDCKWGK